MLENINHPEQKNFCDDGEIAAGRVLLNMLERHELDHRALFVVRYFGDNKLGKERFTCMELAAGSVISDNLFNSVLNREQKLNEQANEPEHVMNSEQRQRAFNQIRGVPQSRRRYQGSRQQARSYRGGRPSYRAALNKSQRRGVYGYGSGRTSTRGARPTTQNQGRSHAPNPKRRRSYSNEETTNFNFSNPRQPSFPDEFRQEQDMDVRQPLFSDDQSNRETWGSQESVISSVNE